MTSRGKRERPEDVIAWRIPRPFPSSVVLASLPSKLKVIPLLRDVLPEKKNLPKDESEEMIDNQDLPAIDDCKNSTLTKGQHERYLKLRSEHTFHREYRNLRGLIREEQEKYRKCQQQFFEDNASRFLVGFVSPTLSEYSTWHSRYTNAYSQQWRDTSNESATPCPLSFGKVRQLIHLSSQHDRLDWVPSEMFDTEILQVQPRMSLVSNNISLSNTGTTTGLPTCLPAFIEPHLPPLLRHDTIALALAEKHGVSAIISSNVLEHVLTLKEWKVPLWNEAAVRILDEPIPQPALVRACLTRGMEEGLNKGDIVYTLFTMKPKGKKILVRGRIIDCRVHLEYFPERGSVEVVASEERATWMLDNLITKRTLHLVRINVSQDWTFKSQEPVSVAHALANGNDVMTHWNRLMIFLHAIESMPIDGDYLMQYQDQSVSFHRASEKDRNVDLDEELKNADVVKTGMAALIACARPWEWNDPNHAEDTFPLAQK